MKDLLVITVWTVLGVVLLGWVGRQTHTRNSLCAAMVASNLMEGAQGQPGPHHNVRKRLPVSRVQGALELRGYSKIVAVPGEPSEFGVSRQTDDSSLVVDHDA